MLRWGNMFSELEVYKIEKSYRNYYLFEHKHECKNDCIPKRDIRKEMIKGYMKLLTDRVNYT